MRAIREGSYTASIDVWLVVNSILGNLDVGQEREKEDS